MSHDLHCSWWLRQWYKVMSSAVSSNFPLFFCFPMIVNLGFILLFFVNPMLYLRQHSRIFLIRWVWDHSRNECKNVNFVTLSSVFSREFLLNCRNCQLCKITIQLKGHWTPQFMQRMSDVWKGPWGTLLAALRIIFRFSYIRNNISVIFCTVKFVILFTHFWGTFIRQIQGPR
jgi:hypothetical protein